MGDVSATHEWRSLDEFVVGDTIHQWGDDLPVTRIVPTGYRIKLYYTDIYGKEDHVDNRASAGYIAKKRDEIQGRVIAECEAVEDKEEA